MKKSLQGIQDFYVDLGYKGERLRGALLKDKEYQKLLRERKQKLAKRFLDKTEKKYVLSTNQDFESLEKIKSLEKLRLTKEDNLLVKFIRSQLELEWRKPILKELDRISKKYSVV